MELLGNGRSSETEQENLETVQNLLSDVYGKMRKWRKSKSTGGDKNPKTHLVCVEGCRGEEPAIDKQTGGDYICLTEPCALSPQSVLYFY